MKSLTNYKLRTLAVIEAQLTKGLETPSEYLLPIIQSIISKYENKALDIEAVIKKVFKEFNLQIPYYLFESLIPSLERVGSLFYDQELKVYICKKTNFTHDIDDLNDDHFELVENKVSEHGARYGLERPLSAKSWQDLLISFFTDHDESATATKIVDEKREKDLWVLSRFILEAKTLNNDLYKILKRIYVGLAIAETITTIQETGHLKDWNGISIIYDSPVLLRLSGTSGTLLRDATIELHSLLQGNGCKTFYFDHSLSEATSSLDATAHRYRNNLPIHKETARALESGEITASILNMMRGDLGELMGKYNISEIDLPNRMSNVSGQVNPMKLEQYLKDNIPYRKNEAARYDADSIEKTLFLRGGRRSPDLTKNRFIFVTHNHKLAFCSYKYCEENWEYRRPDIPPIFTLSALTRIAWLASDNGDKKIDLTKELICKCYQASLPDDEWFNKFWKTIENCNPELLDYKNDNSLYLLDIRKIAEEETMGRSDLLDLVDFGSIITRAQEASKLRAKQHSDKLEELIEENKKLIEIHSKEVKEICQNKEKEIICEAEKREKIYINIDKKSLLRARLIVRSITAIIVVLCICSFLSDFFVSGTSQINAINFSRIAVAILGSLQIIGLFYSKFSIVFFGPYFEQWLKKKIAAHYLSIIGEA